MTTAEVLYQNLWQRRTPPAGYESLGCGALSAWAREVAALVASFAMFFALLSAAYYIVRPVRDEIGVTLGEDAQHQLFTVVSFRR